MPTSPERELHLSARRFRYDPLGFVEMALPWGASGTAFQSWSEPWDWQREVYLDVGREAYEKQFGQDEHGKYPRKSPILRAISSGTGTGKSSSLMPGLAFWFLLTNRASRGLCVAPTGAHAADKMFSNAVALIDASPFLRRYVEYSTGDLMWWVKGCRATRSCVYMTAGVMEALSGKHAHSGCTMVQFDDAAGILDEMFTGTSGARDDPQAFVLACGQPTKLHGWFYRVTHGDLAETWNSRVVSLLEMPGSDDALRDRKIEECGGYDTAEFRTQVLGLPPEPDSRSFITRKLLEEASTRSLYDANGNPLVPPRTPLVAGLDLARPNEDGADNAMAFVAGIDGRTIRPVTVPGISAEERVAWALQEAERDRPPYGKPVCVWYDATALDGMWDAELKRLGRESLFLPVQFGAKPPSGNYRTMRGALWSGARQWLMRGGCIPKDDSLIRLVSAAQSFPDRYGKLLITLKEELGQRAGRSWLDRWDAMMLAFLAPPAHVLDRMPSASSGWRDTARPWAG